MLNQTDRKGIIVAGGSGKRLFPSTISINKHLFPVYDKPMIYYPLSTLMIAGIRDILIITSPSSIDLFKTLLGDGNKWGINLTYSIQKEPKGIAHAISLGEEFIGKNNIVISLGDNIFHGNQLYSLLHSADLRTDRSTIFACQVSDAKRYGVAQFDKHGNVLKIDEKPETPKSNYAITGLYFYNNSVFDKIKKINFSNRNELEVTSLNNIFIKDGLLKVELIGRGIAWFDVGTVDSLHNASAYIRTIQLRQGLRIGCPEEVAWRKGWINNKELISLAESMKPNSYGDYLSQILKMHK